MAALRRSGFCAPAEGEVEGEAEGEAEGEVEEAEAEAAGEEQEEEGAGREEEGRLRPMCAEDVPRCLELMRARAHRFDLAPLWGRGLGG